MASERVLNGAIVAADISQSFEEYVEIFDHFYAEDIEGTTDAAEESVHGKAAVPSRFAGFLVPLHVFAKIGGEYVSIQSSPIREDRPDEAYSTWTLQLRGLTGTTCTVTWSSRRRWLRGESSRNITMTIDGSASHLRLGPFASAQMGLRSPNGPCRISFSKQWRTLKPRHWRTACASSARTQSQSQDIRESHYDYCPPPDSSAVHETMRRLSMMCCSLTNCGSGQNSF